jgi:hypothetical protein
MLQFTRIVALVCTGLYAGIIFGDRLGASYSRQALDLAGGPAVLGYDNLAEINFL